MRKMIQVQACFCDNCKKEIKTINRQFIKFGTGNWDDDKGDRTNVTLEVCDDCYKLILELVSETSLTQKETSPVKMESNEERVANLYKRKISYDEIAKMTGLSKNQVVYIIKKVRSQGARRDDYESEQAMERQKQMDSKPILRTIVDKNGFVVG